MVFCVEGDVLTAGDTLTERREPHRADRPTTSGAETPLVTRGGRSRCNGSSLVIVHKCQVRDLKIPAAIRLIKKIIVEKSKKKYLRHVPASLLQKSKFSKPNDVLCAQCRLEANKIQVEKCKTIAGTPGLRSVEPDDNYNLKGGGVRPPPPAAPAPRRSSAVPAPNNVLPMRFTELTYTLFIVHSSPLRFPAAETFNICAKHWRQFSKELWHVRGNCELRDLPPHRTRYRLAPTLLARHSDGKTQPPAAASVGRLKKQSGGYLNYDAAHMRFAMRPALTLWRGNNQKQSI
ncbi:hypothetical protein EVAR_43367_1 [Eumeta japonica]|uniref:Uncharacterized protein n=1 Tax=Eumeta variegata TaxID=151549 RepID=A0A4C1WP73_EUMVA|nr:hypothetical protein EVAR_43367_1 [Eumeta japonica]